MYTETYDTTATNEKITAFNRAQMVRDWFADAYPYKFTRAEKKHLLWTAKVPASAHFPVGYNTN